MEWHMEEHLCFPAHFGTVQQGSRVQIEPNWQCEQATDSVLVKGVYVLKGHMQFDFKAREAEQQGTIIEHLELEKDAAYFEYALPFSIDLPSTQAEQIDIKVLKANVTVNEQGQCICHWDVRCKMKPNEAEEDKQTEAMQKESIVQEEMTVPPSQPLDYVQALLKETPPLTEEADFLQQLAEAYSIVNVHLQAKK